MKIFFSVGEPSGDVHGANLVRQLRQQHPSIECVGYGGPRMAEAGMDLQADLTQFAVMFFSQVFSRVPQFWRLYRRADRYFQSHPVDAVVLIDYPGFNWWIAKAAKRQGIPVFYYGVPQMWAWGSWRIHKLRRRVDRVICKLPFEQRWFEKRGCPARFVGHPYFDELSQRPLDRAFLHDYDDQHTRLLTLLPGSRDQEVSSNLPWMLDAADDVRQKVPDVSVAIACFNEQQHEQVLEQVERRGLPFDVMHDRTPELIELADVCLACSGSVSLELMYHGKPSVIVYRLSSLRWLMKRLFLNVPYITLVNLLWWGDLDQPRDRTPDPRSRQVPFPEFAQIENPAAAISRHLRRWLNRPTAMRQAKSQLNQICQQFAAGGATERAAQEILSALRDAGPTQAHSSTTTGAPSMSPQTTPHNRLDPIPDYRAASQRRAA